VDWGSESLTNGSGSGSTLPSYGTNRYTNRQRCGTVTIFYGSGSGYDF
jgi:hypothetical protein